MSSFWNSCLSQFEQELPQQQFNTWIRPLRLEGEDNAGDGLRLVAPNGFILKWVKEKYASRIEELARAYFQTPVSVAVTLGERRAAPVPRRKPRRVISAMARSSARGDQPHRPRPAAPP